MSTTPTFPGVLELAIENRLAQLHTSMPGRIESYDAATQKASVKPLLRKKYRDGQAQDLPVITNVPVMFPRAGGAILSFPVQKGDTVLLQISERSLEEWLSSGREVTPSDPRSFDLTDAIAIPGLFPFSSPSPNAHAEDVVLAFNGMEFRLAQSGDITIANEARAISITKSGKIQLGATEEGTVGVARLNDETISDGKVDKQFWDFWGGLLDAVTKSILAVSNLPQPPAPGAKGDTFVTTFSTNFALLPPDQPSQLIGKINSSSGLVLAEKGSTSASKSISPGE